MRNFNGSETVYGYYVYHYQYVPEWSDNGAVPETIGEILTEVFWVKMLRV